MKKGLLVVSFGTSYKETRKKCIEPIEKRLEIAFPDYQVRRAFTSGRIIKKIKEREGIDINQPYEALNKMIKEGVEEIHVQPLHIIPGFEYEKVEKAIIQIRHKSHVKISLGAPLLNTNEHYDEVIEVLLEQIGERRKKRATVLMGHGTKHFSNACYSMLQNKLRDRREDIYIINVEGYPKMHQRGIELVNKYTHIKLMPFMIVAGDHAIHDMAGSSDSMKSYLEDQGVQVETVLVGLGENKRIQDIFVKRTREALQ